MAKSLGDNAAWFDKRVEAFVDGDLSIADKASFVERLHADAGLQGEVERARFIREQLASVETAECPPAVTDAVLRYARGEPRVRQDRPRLRLISGPRVTWTSAVAACAAVLVFFWAQRPPGVDDVEGPVQVATAAPDSREVNQAMREAQWTLAFLSDVGRRTGQTVRREIIEDQVIAQVNKAFGVVLVGEQDDNGGNGND